MNKLILVKLIVSLLTFLLVLGLIFAGHTIYRQTQKKPINQIISLNQPKGSYIDNFYINNNNIYILIKGGKLSDRILIFNQDDSNTFNLKLN